MRRNVWSKLIKFLPYIVFALVALLILGPILKKGYVFTLDSITPPHYPAPTDTTTWRYFYNYALFGLNQVLPSYVIEKIVLFLIIFLSGLGIYKLVPIKSEWPKYAAAFLYIFNPFVYYRLLYGQNQLLLAYALTPFALKSIFNLYESFKLKNVLAVIFWLAIITFINLRNLNFILILLAITFLVLLIKLIVKLQYKKIILTITIGIAILAIFWLLAGNWLGQLFNFSGRDILNVNQEQEIAFQTNADPQYGLWFNVLSLYGFWGERYNQVDNLKNYVPIWPLLSVIIFLSVLTGIYYALKNRDLRDRALILTIVGALSLIVAIGIADGRIYPIAQFFDKVFFLVALREPQKFVSLLCLVYVFFLAASLDNLSKYLIKSKVALYSFAGIFILLPIVYSIALIWGGNKQLCISDYPQSWRNIQTTLNQDSSDYKVLFFPWHRYLAFKFSCDKVIENPAPGFFNKPMISGDNFEMAGIYTQGVSHQSEYIKKEFLDKRNTINDLADKLLGLKVKYIILAKEADWQEYDFLDRQDGLSVVYEDNETKLYRNLLK